VIAGATPGKPRGSQDVIEGVHFPAWQC
jgi:hypothetical protein